MIWREKPPCDGWFFFITENGTGLTPMPSSFLFLLTQMSSCGSIRNYSTKKGPSGTDTGEANIQEVDMGLSYKNLCSARHFR